MEKGGLSLNKKAAKGGITALCIAGALLIALTASGIALLSFVIALYAAGLAVALLITAIRKKE